MTRKELDALNERYANATALERVKLLFEDRPVEDILVTSSFGITSVYALYLVNQVKPGHPVHFIDTKYHFPETIAFRKQLAELLDLNVVDVRPKRILNQWTSKYKAWEQNADLCCQINKVEPLAELKKHYKVWVSGVRADQSQFRQKKDLFEWDGSILKFYPMLDVTEEEVRTFAYVRDLPKHPLLEQGYLSIGCSHCTKPGKGREGRWQGMEKTECGLHSKN